MEARLSKQLLHIVELDKAGHLTPAIQEQISDALDHLHQRLAPGGSVGLPTSTGLLGGVSNAGLGKFINAGPKVRAPKPSFPKLSAAPKYQCPSRPQYRV